MIFVYPTYSWIVLAAVTLTSTRASIIPSNNSLLTSPEEAKSEVSSQILYTRTTPSTAKPDDDGNIEDCELKIGQSDEHQCKCENNGTHLKLCNYDIEVGITRRPENVTHLEAVKFLKAKKLMLTPSMEIILQSVGQEIWMEKHNKTVPVKVPPHTRFIMRQVVATCGSAYEIRTPNTNLQALALPAQYRQETNGDFVHSSFSRESESFENWQGTNNYVFDVSQSYENEPDYESEENLVNDEAPDFDCENWDSGCDRPKLQQPEFNKLNNTRSVFPSHVYLRSGIIADDKHSNASTMPRFNILIVLFNCIGPLLIFKVL